MKRHLAASLFALSLCALPGGARAAEAQVATATVPSFIDSTAALRADADSPSHVAASAGAGVPSGPMVLTSTRGILNSDGPAVDVAAPAAVAAIQGRDWKMPTSRTLMIGGVAAAIIGLAVVGGDTGAIIAMAGGGVAVYGLYLHYNR